MDIIAQLAHGFVNCMTPLNMTMEEALKLITSSGLITPEDKNKTYG